MKRLVIPFLILACLISALIIIFFRRQPETKITSIPTPTPTIFFYPTPTKIATSTTTTLPATGPSDLLLASVAGSSVLAFSLGLRRFSRGY